ncbi:MAG TPA: GerMN domain-containing protein, partial [Gaiella sp.]
MRLAIPAAVGACALTVAAPALGAVDGTRGEVWFLRAGEPVAVTRTAPAIPGLLRSLLAGPTRGERARGLRSAIPHGTVVRDVAISRRVVTVDLAARFAAGRDEASLTARVGQLVRTLRSVRGVVGVRVRIEGGIPVGLFPGYDLRRTVRAPLAERSRPSLRDDQQLLADLGFMAPGGVTGAPGEETSVAVLAFEKWSGLPRDGVLDDDVVKALARATRPEPVLHEPGKRVELLLDRQVALAIDDDRVERVFHISSGSGGRTPTGSFRVYRKERMSWSVPFSTWMPWASYFTGGIAFHAYGYVPAYPASHGCVRM